MNLTFLRSSLSLIKEFAIRRGRHSLQLHYYSVNIGYYTSKSVQPPVWKESWYISFGRSYFYANDVYCPHRQYHIQLLRVQATY